MSQKHTRTVDVPNAETAEEPSAPKHSFALSRRTLMVGAAGVAALGLPSTAIAERDVAVPVHTRQTYRSIVDAMVPRTDDADGVDRYGALDVELEKFQIISINFGTGAPEPSGDRIADARARKARRRALRVELSLEDGGLAQLVEALEAELGFSAQEDLGMAPAEVFGSLLGLDHRIDGDGDSHLVVESVGAEGDVETTSYEDEEVPLATLFAPALDLYALLLVLGGANQEPIQPRQAFRGGGFYTFLGPSDRMRCILFASAEADRLEGVVDELLPSVAAVGDLVSATLVSGLIGYYTEWAGTGETKTNPPLERELEVPVDEVHESVQGYRQIGWGGPADGYADYEDPPIAEFRENDWPGADDGDGDGGDDDDDAGWWF